MANHPHQDAVHSQPVEAECVVESVRRIPIRQRVDVLVCGGGPVGVGAGIRKKRRR